MYNFQTLEMPKELNGRNTDIMATETGFFVLTALLKILFTTPVETLVGSLKILQKYTT